MSGTVGDWVMPPPSTPANAMPERYRVTPRPRIVIATPETMWSTPNVTVASACNAPPSAPPRIPAITPVHGPHW